MFLFLHWELNSYALFLYWHPYRKLVTTYALSCLCIPVYNTVVKWVLSHATSSRCGKVVIWMCLRLVSILWHFCLFFKMCAWCFQQPSGNSGTRAYLEFSITIYIGERELTCFAYLCHHPRSHFTKLLTRALFFVPCHCSYIFVPCLAFCVHVAGDLNKTISFIVGVSLDFVCSCFTQAHLSESELPYEINYFLKHNSYQIECFWSIGFV